ncbi:MAG TPA: class I SAM-dependent methyltransferase [Streptosporangiaceae bacterium]|nr:class I SAM-dependent methyltransferase [Streptosporangiaceae bacterium]
MMDAPGFNAWHADVANSPACALIFQRALGLPAQVVSNSLLTGAGIAEVAAALQVAPGQILVDLACGRGGYGREVARQTGARLAGLDFSAAAVTIAARGRPRSRARFCVGDFTALGLRDHSAHAVMCIDAIQFSDPPVAALRECRRILAGGGRLAVTAWEPRGPVPEGVPERIRRMNLARDLLQAGFEQIEVTEKPHWYAAERTLWEAALQADASGDPALVSLQEEATQALAAFDVRRRVLATATAPAEAVQRTPLPHARGS